METVTSVDRDYLGITNFIVTLLYTWYDWIIHNSLIGWNPLFSRNGKKWYMYWPAHAHWGEYHFEFQILSDWNLCAGDRKWFTYCKLNEYALSNQWIITKNNYCRVFLFYTMTWLPKKYIIHQTISEIFYFSGTEAKLSYWPQTHSYILHVVI